MKTPTRSLKLIRREMLRARKDRSMAVLHPDTVEWLIERIAKSEGRIKDSKEQGHR